MPDFKRFVTYLYSYEHNTKLQIAGFAKVEVRGGQCRLEIHLKAAGIAGRSLPVYLFAREENLIQAVEIGKVTMGQLSGDFKAILKDAKINRSPYDMQDMKGLLLIVDERKMFASQWDEDAISREQIRIYEPGQEETKQSEKEEEPRTETKQEPDMDSEQEEESQPLHVEELPMRNIITPDFTVKKTLWNYWEDIKHKMTVMRPFEGENIFCVHMELRDIRELPKKYWYFANNSFLLRGFFQYKYLLMGECEREGEKALFLGVPGVYQKQEKIMASIFGFPDFLSEKAEETPENKFGYWCHFICE